MITYFAMSFRVRILNNGLYVKRLVVYRLKVNYVNFQGFYISKLLVVVNIALNHSSASFQSVYLKEFPLYIKTGIRV